MIRNRAKLIKSRIKLFKTLNKIYYQFATFEEIAKSFGMDILLISDNFAIQLEANQIKYIDVNGTKYAIVYIDNDPIHIEPMTE
jgi:hypothetical protein